MVDQQITALDERPLVSVIIPAYNAELFIEETLKSVLAQTYKNIEVIVVDDGSQDKTGEIVEKFCQLDQRVKLFKQANAGVAVARNTAIEIAQGEFIAPIDADDIWYPENIAKQVECFGRSPANVGVVYSWSIDIDQNSSPTGEFRASLIEGKVYSTLICHNFTGNASSTMIRHSCFTKLGGYRRKIPQNDSPQIVADQNSHLICEDWDLYLRIAEYYEYRVVPEFLIGYRQISNSMSSNCQGMASSYELILADNRLKHLELPNWIYRLSRSTFYLYLARQNYQYGYYEKTISWLLKSWQADPTTLWLRLLFYKLIITSCWQLLIKQLPIKFDQQKLNIGKTSDQSISIEDFQNRRRNIYLKLLVSRILHEIMPTIELNQDLSP